MGCFANSKMNKSITETVCQNIQVIREDAVMVILASLYKSIWKSCCPHSDSCVTLLVNPLAL